MNVAAIERDFSGAAAVESSSRGQTVGQDAPSEPVAKPRRGKQSRTPAAAAGVRQPERDHRQGAQRGLGGCAGRRSVLTIRIAR